ncbi:MAG: hypothetical protein ACUVV3_03070 [Dehalococcoidia bacterium]
MERVKAGALAWFLTLLLSASLAAGTPAQGAELLVNGGFENELGSEWAATSGDSLDLIGTPSLVHGGSYAGRLVCAGPDNCGVQQLVAGVGYAQEYELRAYVLWNEGDVLSLTVRVQWFDELGGEVGWVDALVGCTVEADEPYRCLTTGALTAPAKARSAKIKVAVFLKDGVESSILYLDDFSFGGPPAPTPSPTQPPSPTASPSPSPWPTAWPVPSRPPGPSPVIFPTPTKVAPAATPSASSPTPTAALVNGGFEETDDDGRPLGWRKYGGELRRTAAAKWEGQFAAAFTSRTTSTKWVFQTLAVDGGKAYLLGGYALKNDANVAAVYLRLSWYASPDGSGRAIGIVDSTARLTDDSPDFRFLTTEAVVAPAEAASAKVRLMLDPLSEAEATVYFDAISFSEMTLPPQPEETAESPPSASDSEGPAQPGAAPATSGGQVKPAPTGDASPPRASPVALGATSGRPTVAASGPSESAQGEPDRAATPTRTPTVLYRERNTGQSTQGGDGVAAGNGADDSLSPIVLILVTALPVTALVATALFLWWHRRRAAAD